MPAQPMLIIPDLQFSWQELMACAIYDGFIVLRYSEMPVFVGLYLKELT
ncbi:hypothetical protein Tsp_15230 [Trichinella spiralis]|nr:hypothetical protein Tsp_15230 [Trichinella spiralis]